MLHCAPGKFLFLFLFFYQNSEQKSLTVFFSTSFLECGNNVLALDTYNCNNFFGVFLIGYFTGFFEPARACDTSSLSSDKHMSLYTQAILPPSAPLTTCVGTVFVNTVLESLQHSKLTQTLCSF